MATALHRLSLELRHSVDPTELPGDPADWLLHPDLSAVEGVPRKHWKIVGDRVAEMTDAEKAAVAAAELAAHKQAKLDRLRAEAVEKLGRATKVYRDARAAVEAARTGDEIDAVELGEFGRNPFDN